MRFRSMSAVLLAGLLLLPQHAAQTTPPEAQAAKRADIRKLLELTGAASLGRQVMEQMMDSVMPLLKQSAPSVPEEVWKEFAAEFTDASATEELIEITIVIYDKHLTHDEVRGLIAFYQTPLGKKLVQVLPAIGRESMEAGGRWGEERGRKIVERIFEKLRQRGYEVPKTS